VTPALAVRQLCVWHGRAQAVFNIDLEVWPGECVGLLGRNGVGKTSTIMAIIGVEVKSGGEIEIFGVNCARQRPEQRARLGVAWIPDSRRILSKLTVRENLEIAGRSGAPPSGNTVTMKSVLERFPILGPLLDKKGTALSGGEQQLVAIARAIISNPQLALIDEPTEGLAPKIVEQVKDALFEMRQQQGIACLLVEQNLPFAVEMTDRIYIMDRGRIISESSSAEFGQNKQLQMDMLGKQVNDFPADAEPNTQSSIPSRTDGSSR
jgi:branched-chain amino acid transport system ATP-binding protein